MLKFYYYINRELQKKEGERNDLLPKGANINRFLLFSIVNKDVLLYIWTRISNDVWTRISNRFNLM